MRTLNTEQALKQAQISNTELRTELKTLKKKLEVATNALSSRASTNSWARISGLTNKSQIVTLGKKFLVLMSPWIDAEALERNHIDESSVEPHSGAEKHKLTMAAALVKFVPQNLHEEMYENPEFCREVFTSTCWSDFAC